MGLRCAFHSAPDNLVEIAPAVLFTASFGLLTSCFFLQARVELSEDQKAEIREAFDLFDTDNNGGIDYHELKVCLRALGFDVTKDQVRKLMTEHDIEEKGEINFEAFTVIMAEKFAERNEDDEIMKAFQLFDEEGKGTISIKNMRKVARELGESLSEEELRAMLDEFSSAGDGEVTQEDFFAIMKATSVY